MNYFNPFYYLLKLKFIRTYYFKHGVNDVQELITTASNNPKAGINSIQAGGLMIGLIGFILFGIFNYIQIFFSVSLSDWVFKTQTNDMEFLFSLFIISLTFNYFTLFKEDKYLEYFEDFEEMSVNNKKKYYWISFGIILMIILFFIFSFEFIK